MKAKNTRELNSNNETPSFLNALISLIFSPIQNYNGYSRRGETYKGLEYSKEAVCFLVGKS